MNIFTTPATEMGQVGSHAKNRIKFPIPSPRNKERLFMQCPSCCAKANTAFIVGAASDRQFRAQRKIKDIFSQHYAATTEPRPLPSNREKTLARIRRKKSYQKCN